MQWRANKGRCALRSLPVVACQPRRALQVLALSIRIECLARDLGRTYLVSLSFLLASSQFIWDEIAEAKCHFGPTLDFASVPKKLGRNQWKLGRNHHRLGPSPLGRNEGWTKWRGFYAPGPTVQQLNCCFVLMVRAKPRERLFPRRPTSMSISRTILYYPGRAK